MMKYKQYWIPAILALVVFLVLVLLSDGSVKESPFVYSIF